MWNKNTMNLVSHCKKLDLNELVFLWHFISKFASKPIVFKLGLETDPNQHYLSSLIYKIDHMNKKFGYEIDLQIFFKSQLEDMNKDLTQYIYADNCTMFTQQSLTNIIYKSWKINEHCYNKAGEELDRILPVYTTVEEIQGNSLEIVVFNDQTKKTNYYLGWLESLKQKYLEDEVLFKCL